MQNTSLLLAVIGIKSLVSFKKYVPHRKEGADVEIKICNQHNSNSVNLKISSKTLIKPQIKNVYSK